MKWLNGAWMNGWWAEEVSGDVGIGRAGIRDSLIQIDKEARLCIPERKMPKAISARSAVANLMTYGGGRKRVTERYWRETNYREGGRGGGG